MKNHLFSGILLFFSILISAQTEPFQIGTRNIAVPKKGTYATDTLGPVSSLAQLGTYGGCLDQKVEASGYYYTKQIDGTWYMVDPEGYLFYTVGITSVEKGGGINLPADLKQWGINALGNWSDESITGLPFCPRFTFLQGFKNTSTYRKELFNEDIFPVFDPGFESWVDAQAKAFVAPYVTNPWVLGYHTDNELRFHYVDISKFLTLPETDAHYIAAKNFMLDRKGAISPITDTDIEDFRAFVAETYMATVNTALKKYDPNHLNIGCRIHSSVKFDAKLLNALGKHLDVMSINFYGKWEPTKEYMDLWLDDGGKPFLITEFYTKAEDSGLGNDDGAGWLVSTQQDRADHFDNMALSLLGHPGSVGWTWFRYTDKNDANKGILNDNYQYYMTLVESMQNVSKDIYNLRRFLLGQELILSNASLENATQVKGLMIYPNPATETLSLFFPNEHCHVLELFNASGHRMLSQPVSSEKLILNVSDFPQGIYLLRCVGEGKDLYEKVFIH